MTDQTQIQQRDGFEQLVSGLIAEGEKRLVALVQARTAAQREIERIEAALQPVRDALAYYRRRRDQARPTPRPQPQHNGLRARLLELAAQANGTLLTAADLALRLAAEGLPTAHRAVNNALSRLAQAGRLERVAYGKYCLAAAAGGR